MYRHGHRERVGIHTIIEGYWNKNSKKGKLTIGNGIIDPFVIINCIGYPV